MSEEINEPFDQNLDDEGFGGRIKNNSRQCAYLINRYWFERGYDAQARTTRDYGKLIVVSNMIGGYPTRKIRSDAK